MEHSEVLQVNFTITIGSASLVYNLNLVTSDPLQGRGKLTLGTVATGAGMSAAAPDCGLN